MAFQNIALLLQGGGALGAYQAGVYEALAEADIPLDWVAGISIGAINGALIVGNEPKQHVNKLRAFWEGITAKPAWRWSEWPSVLLTHGGDAGRQWLNQMNAGLALLNGAPGFFTPRLAAPWLCPVGTANAEQPSSLMNSLRLV
jgi:NTE family protein